MNKFLNMIATHGKIAKAVVILLVCIFLIFGIVFSIKSDSDRRVEIRAHITELVEYAYMEGQIDYAEGDIRITSEGSDWVWTKSPWDSGEKPVFEYMSEYSYGN